MAIYGQHIHRPPKTVSNNNEAIAVKFDIGTVCTQEIIMGYMGLEEPKLMLLLSYEIGTCYLFKSAEPPLTQLLGDTSFQELRSMWCQNSNHMDNLHLPTNHI